MNQAVDYDGEVIDVVDQFVDADHDGNFGWDAQCVIDCLFELGPLHSMFGFEDFSEDLNHIFITFHGWKLYLYHVIPELVNFITIIPVFLLQRVTFI